MDLSLFGKNFSQIENVQIINTCFLDNKRYSETGIFYGAKYKKAEFILRIFSDYLINNVAVIQV